ncbi:MAG: PEP-utilizing enzyme [Pseudonocardia sp.]
MLVTPRADPSWASIKLVSAALVLDTGGTLRHAATVARESGLPCVVNTRVGSRALRTGDRCGWTAAPETRAAGRLGGHRRVAGPGNLVPGTARGRPGPHNGGEQ